MPLPPDVDNGFSLLPLATISTTLEYTDNNNSNICGILADLLSLKLYIDPTILVKVHFQIIGLHSIYFIERGSQRKQTFVKYSATPFDLQDLLTPTASRALLKAVYLTEQGPLFKKECFALLSYV